MPLLFNDPGEWQKWADSQKRLLNGVRRVKATGKRADAETMLLYVPPEPAKTLVIMDQRTPSWRPSLWEPLARLDARRTAVLASPEVDLPKSYSEASVSNLRSLSDLPTTSNAVLALGVYSRDSKAIYDWAIEHGMTYYIVQHGLLTPWAPPAPDGAHVLAWCDADANMWGAGQRDVQVDVVGSQMLWNVAQLASPGVQNDKPVMLGQLHGTELPTRQMLKTYIQFARETPSDYRPHPNEADAVSRMLHRVMKQRDVTFDRSGVPLPTLGKPVVSIFSTGTLEAATRGLPAWVYHPNPPRWIEDFWERYGLSQWGRTATRKWAMPSLEPAAAIAAAVENV